MVRGNLGGGGYGKVIDGKILTNLYLEQDRTDIMQPVYMEKRSTVHANRTRPTIAPKAPNTF